jgi:hypothetical protein
MLSLPPAAPVVGWRTSLRLPRDHYVRVASNDYSVDPTVVGRRVEVAADLEHVTVTCAGKVVARHLRCWAAHQSLTDPDHAAIAAACAENITTSPPAASSMHGPRTRWRSGR